MKLAQIRAKITPILKDQGVLKAAIFGSYATGEAKPSSDIDLLVKLEGRKSLFDLVGLKLDLEDALDKKVDLLTYDSIHPPLREIILNEQQIIYEKRS